MRRGAGAGGRSQGFTKGLASNKVGAVIWQHRSQWRPANGTGEFNLTAAGEPETLSPTAAAEDALTRRLKEELAVVTDAGYAAYLPSSAVTPPRPPPRPQRARFAFR